MAIKTAIGVLVAAAILAVMAVSASAAPNPGFGTGGKYIDGTGIKNASPSYSSPLLDDGPQTANVPYLAWVGEEVKLVACDPAISNGLPADTWHGFQQGVYSVEDWTGDQAYASTPTFDGSEATNLTVTNTGGAYFFAPNDPASADDKGCVSADIKSLHSGLAEVKLDVSQEGGDACIAGQDVANCENTPSLYYELAGDTTRQVFSHQFVVIWMTPNAPTLSEESVSSLSGPSDQLTSLGTANATGTCPSTNSPYSDPSLTNCTGYVGDPSGNGEFSPDLWSWDEDWNAATDNGGNNWFSNDKTPQANNGLVDINVTGSFPVEDQPPATTNTSYFAPVTGGGNPATITLPTDWVKLADLMATSSDSPQGTNPNLWDIHGTPTNTLAVQGHAGSSTGQCENDTPSLFMQMTDVVDDCVSNGHGGSWDADAFSRVYGDVTNEEAPTGNGVGPYDPEAPNETLIPDGQLNTSDAPMPALPITLSITPNAGGTDIGGVGGLYAASKAVVYSHDFNGAGLESNGSNANLYNPYYSEYIPSTTRPINEASGVDGVYDGGYPNSSGNDFPGFSNGYTSPYKFWDALDVSTTDKGGPTACLHYVANTYGDAEPGDYYQNPHYPTSVLVYTDERGEAMVDYNPGTGFYWNNLIAAGDISIDNNNACDLQGLLNDPIGTSTISAQVEFPYQAVPYTAPAGANTETKTVYSRWSKTLTAYNKLISSVNPGVYDTIFVAKAVDINGQPFVGETVCFSQQGNGLLTQDFLGQVWSGPNDTGTLEADTSGDIKPVHASIVSNSPGDGYCEKTGSNGEAAIEVTGSGPPTIDEVAEFVNEHLFRDVTVTLGQTTPVTSGTPPTVIPVDPVVAAPTGSAGGSGSSESSSNAGSGSATVTPLSTGKVTNACKVDSFHMFSKRGYVQLKVSCTESKTDSVLLRTYRSNGKLMNSVRKTIKTGKVVTIRLSLKKVKRLKVTV